MQNISLIIPIFNEEKNIDKLFNEILDTGVYEVVSEIIYVDDCSNDNSFKNIKLLEEKYTKVTILKHETNLGQSHCIRTAAEYSNKKELLTIDGDCQNNPKDIHKLIQAYYSDSNIFLVGGIRINRKDSLVKILSSKIANKIRMLILKDKCVDTGCSLKIFNREIFLSFPFFNGIHRFLPALFNGFGRKTNFINVDHRPRIHGNSKYGTFNRLVRGIADILKVIKILGKKN